MSSRLMSIGFMSLINMSMIQLKYVFGTTFFFLIQTISSSQVSGDKLNLFIMKKLLMFVAIAMMVASAQAQTQIAYLDLYQRGGARHLRTTLMFDGNPIYIGKWNLGEMLNILAKQGWEIDHTLIGANRVMLYLPTRHKFHIVLKKEYTKGTDPFEGLVLTQNAGTKSIENYLPTVPKIATNTINYTAYKNKIISVNIIDHPDFLSNDYMAGQGILTFKNIITHITDGAFRGCFILNSIILPESVVEIGDSAFTKCAYLTDFYCQSIVPPILGKNVFPNSPSLIIYVPQESVNAYKSADGWNLYASKIVGYDFIE